MQLIFLFLKISKGVNQIQNIDVNLFTNINISELTTEQLMSRCLCVMEDMVYTGIEHQYKTIGSIHVLSVLTVRNRDARSNMPWLYESLI